MVQMFLILLKNRIWRSNMKKISTLFLTCILILSALPLQAQAQQRDVIYYADGSYTVITIEESISSVARTTSSKTGTKYYDHYTSGGQLQWKVALKATFTFNGTTSLCTSVQTPVVSIYANDWSVNSKSSSRSGNTATANVEMKKSGLLGSRKYPVTFTLLCDKNGNLS